jgi:hypothetical protein
MRALVLCLLVACGDSSARPDGSVPDAVDAASDAPAPPPGCDFGELRDIDNNVNPESTGLAYKDPLVICGAVDPGHFIPMTTAVDDDVYGFSLSAPARVKVEVTGLAAFPRVEVQIVNGFGDPIATSVQAGSHAVTAASLPAGTAGIAVRVFGDEPLSPIAYVARVTVDAPCMPGTASYTESAAANDVVEVRYTSDPRRALTAAADAPEATGITLAATATLAGTCADVDAADEFRDRDTFAFTTGANVEELAVQLDWTGQADLDLIVFPANATTDLAAATHVAATGGEFAKLAVLPNTSYWVWIGAYDTSTALPVDYTVALCGE